MTARNSRAAMYAALALLGCGFSSASHAVIVTWEATGHLTEIDRSGALITEFASAAVGDTFTVRYTFDTASPLDNTRVGENGGLLYEWFSAIIDSSLSIGGETLARSHEGSLLRLRDNFAGELNFSLPATDPVDGITFDQNVSSAAAGGFASYSIIFRGPEDLNLYSGSALPETPAAILPFLSLHEFQFTDNSACGGEEQCVSSFFLGQVDGLVRVGETPVPEPASLALFAFGLLGAGYARRRRS